MLHGLLTAALAAVLALWMPCVHAQAAALPEPVARALAEAGIPESATAFYVHEIGAERPLIAAGADRSMNPASTIKLVTTYAALELLGPAFQWVRAPAWEGGRYGLANGQRFSKTGRWLAAR